MIKKLDWDSNHFGINIANLDYDHSLNDFGDIEKFVRENKIKIMQCCCDISDVRFINFLEKNGFHFVDIKMTYFLDLKNIDKNDAQIAFATNKDASVLKRIAASVFVNKSRYYNSFFNRIKADELFELWIENSINGKFDDLCIKFEQDGIVAGFITGKKTDDSNARIGLIGVDGNFQGRGIGAELLKSLFSFYKSEEVSNINVSTQGKNIVANNFYIKNGFIIKSVEAWLYKECN